MNMYDIYLVGALLYTTAVLTHVIIENKDI